ncbi:MAG TPA: DNA primase [Lachnospiraceae bacterium]|nr:DNA primase [Lachnospiraceae bacterium]
MFYSQELVEEVRTQNDIVEVISSYIPLKQKGGSYFGLCPFHNEGTPSFSVSAEKQLYYCFGCGAAGNVISFIMQMENCDFVEAIKRLADRANIAIAETEYTKETAEEEKLRADLFEIHNVAGRFYYEVLQAEEGKNALDYLEKRQVSLATQRKFGLGYAPLGKDRLYNVLKEKGFSVKAMIKSGLVMENKYGKDYHDRFYGRLMFPIFDVQGRVIGFGGRIMEKGEPKYLNSPETPLFNKKRTLYGLNFARSSKKKEIILVEGYMDMITIYQAGFHNVAASLGTAFNAEHAKLLKKFVTDIILIFDSDTAGETAALRAIPILVSAGFRVRVLQVPNGKDPDEFIKQKGFLEFSKLLVNAKSYMAFQIDCSKKKYNMENIEQKMLFTKESAQMLAKLDSPIERDVYTKEISAETGIAEDAIIDEIIKIKGNDDAQFVKEAEKKRVRMYADKTVGEQIKKSKGLYEAQRNIIYICATKKEIYDKIKLHLKADDFIDEEYKRLAEIVFDAAEKGVTIFPAEAVNYFHTPEAQKKVAEVFAIKFKYDGLNELEKAVNEEIRLIKRTKADALAATATSIEDLNTLMEVKKQLDKLYITL